MGHGAEYDLHERGFSAAVGAYDAQEIVGIDVEVGIAERFGAVVAYADASERDDGGAVGHGSSVSRSVMVRMLAIGSSRSGSNSTGVAPMSSATVATTVTGYWR